MKIEIDIDIESIVREALKEHNSSLELTIPDTKTTTSHAVISSSSKWEYGRKNGRRRTNEEMALHKLEQEKGRLLTPEEKGEAKAVIHIDETTENIVKEAAIKKDRIDKIAAEGMAAASKELAEEAQNTEGLGIDQEEITDSAASDEAEIPKTEPLNIPNSLFTP